MGIPKVNLASAGLGTGSPLKSTIYTDLNNLLSNDISLQTQIEQTVKFRDCGGSCAGTCTTVCTGTCINACTNGCNGSCYNTCTGTCDSGCGGKCTGSCGSGCGGCSGH